MTPRPGPAAALLILSLLGACANSYTPILEPVPATSAPMAFRADDAPPRPDAIDLTHAGVVHRGTSPVAIFDSRLLARPIQEHDPVTHPRRIREILPPHDPAPPIEQDEPNALPLGGMLVEHLSSIEQTWPAIGATGWVPPDPTLAVGPNHVLTTVNMQIAWYTKSGQLQVSIPLNDSGNPGFFETVGAGAYTFDPKCFYDHFAQRYVVLALEVYYPTQEAYLCLAVSDDSDPNGAWHMYRSDAVVNINGSTYWWDYPGFGYDADAYYVTSNLFGLNTGGFNGTGFRIFHKAPLLNGQPAVYSTLRDANASSVQVGQHFGSPRAPFFVSVGSSTELRIRAITNPLTNPALVTTTVTVPTFTGPVAGPTPTGTLNLVDNRIMNVHWRDGNLYTCHNTSLDGRNIARWYHLRTNAWPTAGAVTLQQSGIIDPGSNLHSYFPAIYSNAAGDVGVVIGVSSASVPPGVAVAARRASDPTGYMGIPEIVKIGEVGAMGRWGDYFDIAIDPTDDTTFWAIGEYQQTAGWNNWITSFAVDNNVVCHPLPDDIGLIQSLQSRTIDVLANDWHSNNLPMVIQAFQTRSQRGGTITRSVGTGPGGRDQLTYTAPPATNGVDSFTYTVADPNASTGTAAVSALVTDPATYRNPELPLGAGRLGIDVAYYDLVAPTQLPNFASLSPYARSTVKAIDFSSTDGGFATSERTENVGAAFDAYLVITAPAYYTLALASDDGSRLLLGDTLFINNDGLHGVVEADNSIGLKPGLHRVRIEYFQADGGSALWLSMGPYAGARSLVPASAWRRIACDPDFNQDGNVDQDDIACLAQVIAGDSSCSDLDPDFNQDGNVDQDDIDALTQVIAGAPCP